MNPCVVAIAAVTVALTTSGITGLTAWWALHHRRLAREATATVDAYRNAFGRALDTLTNTPGDPS